MLVGTSKKQAFHKSGDTCILHDLCHSATMVTRGCRGHGPLIIRREPGIETTQVALTSITIGIQIDWPRENRLHHKLPYLTKGVAI
jgi:hypothetical protein